MSPYIGQSEALYRMGGAMIGGAREGGLASLQAGTDQLGAMQDYNRAQQQQVQEAERLEQARRDAIQNMMNKDTPKPLSQQEVDGMQTSLAQMEELIVLLDDDLMTGPIAGRFQAFIDKSGNAGDVGVKRAYARKLLQGFKVDDTLLRTAHTKGAISDKEMALFESPLPDITEDEGVWKLYLNDRAEVIRKVLAANGITAQNTGPTNTQPQAQPQPQAQVEPMSDEGLDVYLAQTKG